jgi:hypothetical protein
MEDNVQGENICRTSDKRLISLIYKQFELINFENDINGKICKGHK